MSADKSRVVVYLQNQENLILLPKCYKNLTAINLSSFHFGFTEVPNPIPYIHLNDHVPEDPRFDTVWGDMRRAQQNGVLLFAMLGGAGGAYEVLFSENNYDTFYPMFVDMLKKYNFDGVDLDVEEEEVTTVEIQKLISDLRNDFPTDFYISAAPVCSALSQGDDPLSKVDWFTLKDQIDWFNVQFYSGFGSLSDVNDYNAIIAKGFEPNQILGGALTNKVNGYGYISMDTLTKTLSALNVQYKGEMGGTMGWEYFNANDLTENENPVGWAEAMKEAVGMQKLITHE